MKDSLTTLSYAIRPTVVATFIGQLLIIQAILALVPLAAALIFGDYAIAIRYLSVIILLLAFSIPMSRFPSPAYIQTNESLVIVALAFMLSPLIMAYPLTAIGLSFEDALFETVSAVTTTGLTTVTDLQARSDTFLFARAWMQWYGGLGIVVLSIALLMGHHLAARQLAQPLSNETIATTARTHARRMLVIYLLMTLIGLLILWAISGDVFNALLHVLTAVSTGGFTPHDASLAAFDSLSLRYAVIFLALCSAVPLPLYYLAWRQNIGTFFRDIELQTLIILILIVSLLLVMFLYFKSGLSLQDSFSHGILLGISAQTGTGFSSINIVDIDDSSKIVTIIAMLVGGGMGSTTGGIKVLRLLILIRLIQLLMQRTSLPFHAVTKPKLAGKLLEGDEIQRVMLLILLFVIVVVVSWLVFVSYGYPPLNALFEVVSATSTAGLSTGIAHTDLPTELKILLCLDMLLGRVEIVALLVVLYPRTWFGKRAQPS